MRVRAEVDPRLEITEIVDRTVRAGGPALLFERPRGSGHALLINQFGTERRMCLAFGVERLDDVAEKLSQVLEMQPPEGLAAKVRGLKMLKSIADSRPKVVRSGACQEVVLRGDDVDLGALPVMTCWPGDAGPFITLPAVITHDPRTGSRNVGMYRMQVLGPRSTAMHWQLHKDGRADFMFSDGRLEVAVALGLDPISAYSASAPLPKHIDEFMLAGFLRDAPVELVKCVSIDLEVPASAEIVLEGYVEQGDLTSEGPFGDHTGYYTPAEPFPVFHVTALTMRRRRDLPVDRGGQAAAGGRLARQGDRAHLPACDPDERARDRRLRPAGRGRVPQPGDRVDPQELPRACAQGDARALGPRPAQPDQGHRRGRRARRRPRLRAGALLRRRQRRPEARRADQRGPARPPRPRTDPPVPRREDRDRRDGEEPGRGGPRVAAGDRDERRTCATWSTAAGPSTGWTRFLKQGTDRSVRVRAPCYDVDRRPLVPVRSPLSRCNPTTNNRTSRGRACGPSASPSAWSSSSSG